MKITTPLAMLVRHCKLLRDEKLSEVDVNSLLNLKTRLSMEVIFSSFYVSCSFLSHTQHYCNNKY